MDTFLTYEALHTELHDLCARYHDYIPRLTNRAHLRPEFDGVSIQRPADPTSPIVAYVVVRIIERTGTPRWPMTYTLNLPYAVYRTGFAVLDGHAQPNHMGGGYAYSEPPTKWAAAILERLTQEAVKARIQARARAIHEELVAAVWSPARLGAMLEKHGWEGVEAS
jgi:hypothetical protein